MKNIIYSFLYTLIIYVATVTASMASTTTYVTNEARVTIISAGIDKNTKQAKLGIHYQLAPGWKLYWRTPGDAGTPTEITLTDNARNITSPTIDWPIPHRHTDFIGKDMILTSYVYSNEVVLPLHATIPDTTKPAYGSFDIHFSVCKNICIPYNTQLALTIPHTANNNDIALYNRFINQVPPYISNTATHETSPLIINKAQFLYKDNSWFLDITAQQTNSSFSIAKSDIFVEHLSAFTTSPPKITLNNQQHTARFLIPLSSTQPLTEQRRILQKSEPTITLTSGTHLIETSLTALPLATEPSSQSNTDNNISHISLMLLYALLGGLILNIMPCVLPVLSIKLFSIIKQSGNQTHRIRISFTATSLGIITSFIILGIGASALKAAGETVGWGIHFQEPAFIIALTIIIVLFALNILDRFYIQLPHWLGSALIAHEQHNSQNHPTLLGYFLTGAFATLLATPCTAPFLGVATGFALSQPSAIIILIFAVMGIGMALPYIIFTLFPSAIRFMPRPGVWMMVAKKILAIFLLATAAWLLWVLSGQLGTVAAIIVAAFCLLIKFVIEKQSGFLARPWIKWLTILLLIATTFIAPFHFVQHMEQQQTRIDTVWETFEPNAINKHLAQGKIVFVDVTADWCTTCQTNKFFVLNRGYMLDIFARPDVVALRLDMTSPNPIANHFLATHNRYGIPFNIVYGPNAPEGIKLPVILTGSRVRDALHKAGLR